LIEGDFAFRPMLPEDIPRVVDLFHRYMPYSQFARFGKPFLTALFEGLVSSPWSLELVTPPEGAVEGFITATFSSEKMMGDILSRQSHHLLGGLVKGGTGAVKAIPKAAENLLYTRRTSLPGIQEELMFIVVDPETRQRGLGRSLIITTLNELRDRGVDTVKVSAVAGNKPVRKLLGKLGFKEAMEFKFHGEEMILYTGSTTVE
jgi:ribosomal protein S18 acetylase RimI-like enzyme